MKLRLRTFLGQGVPLMLPKISATLSVTNFGNNFNIEIFSYAKVAKSAFSIGHFGSEGGAPGRKFFFDVIPID